MFAISLPPSGVSLAYVRVQDVFRRKHAGTVRAGRHLYRELNLVCCFLSLAFQTLEFQTCNKVVAKLHDILVKLSIECLALFGCSVPQVSAFNEPCHARKPHRVAVHAGNMNHIVAVNDLHVRARLCQGAPCSYTSGTASHVRRREASVDQGVQTVPKMRVSDTPTRRYVTTRLLGSPSPSPSPSSVSTES